MCPKKISFMCYNKIPIRDAAMKSIDNIAVIFKWMEIWEYDREESITKSTTRIKQSLIMQNSQRKFTKNKLRTSSISKWHQQNFQLNLTAGKKASFNLRYESPSIGAQFSPQKRSWGEFCGVWSYGKVQHILWLQRRGLPSPRCNLSLARNLWTNNVWCRRTE